MSTNQYPCPDCAAVLKPPKPIKPGQKVKCPKCQKVFIPVPRPDEDDEGGTYGLEQESAEEAARGEEVRRKSLEKSLERRVKSARGPAAAICTPPGNRMMATGTFTCVSCILSLLVLMWPIFFSGSKPKDKDAEVAPLPPPPVAGEPPAEKPKEPEKPPMGKAERWLTMMLVVLAFLYNGMIVYGAVKMLSLESYQWGMTAGGLTIAPFEWGLAYPALFWLFAFADRIDFLPLFFLPLVLVIAWYIYVGATVIQTLRKPEVIAGFNEKRPADV